jgi:hypothetical protein
MCSAVSPPRSDFAAPSAFSSHRSRSGRSSKPVVDRAAHEVRIALPNGVTRGALSQDQGCLTLPEGEKALRYTPSP